MININPIFGLPGYRVSLLGPETIPALQGLLERCTDYSLLVKGEPPDSNAAESMLADCPPGKTQEDKVVIGITDGQECLVGVLDAICGYPAVDCWWLGLLLLDPSYRNQGLGQRIYRSFEQWVGQRGAKNILLGVLEENVKAFRFWRSLGFEVVEKQTPRLFGHSTHTVIVMVCTIAN
jgi:GNAT superfamily N-acetyltransferase